MLDIRLPSGASGKLSRYVGIELEQAKAQFTAHLAHELTGALQQKGRKNIWPQDTGNSRESFLVEDVANSEELVVTNDAWYAEEVNNRQSYASGRENPNYKAAQRQVQQRWPSSVEKALARTEV